MKSMHEIRELLLADLEVMQDQAKESFPNCHELFSFLDYLQDAKGALQSMWLPDDYGENT